MKVNAYKTSLTSHILVAFMMCVFFVPSLTNAKYKVGDKVENFSLRNIDDSTVSLFDHAGENGAIVIFTCNHCPYAKMYEDRIVALDKKFKKQGFPVIAVNPNDPKKQPQDSFENMKVRAEEKGFTFPYVFDARQKTAKKFGATRTPHVFLVKRSGEDYELAYIGAIDDNAKNAADVQEMYVENAIAAVVAGEQVNPSTTKAIGCSIKWKE